MRRDAEYPLSPEQEVNLSKLLISLNKFREIYGKPMIVTSGYRPGHYNTAAGGAGKSAHLTCEAVDFRDSDKSLAKFCLDNLKLLEECGLWMEDPNFTKNWVHLDVRVRKNRVFSP